MERYFLLAFSVLSLTLQSSAGVTYNVTITDASYSPANFTAHVGDTVKWRASSANIYNDETTSLAVPSNAAGWLSGPLTPGDSFSYIITTVGTYSYESTTYNTFSGNFTVLGKTNSVHRVYVADQGFDPDTFEVRVWDSIIWIASPSDRDQNNTLSVSIPEGAIPWTSPTLSPGDTFSYLVTQLGTYVYQSNAYISFYGIFYAVDTITGVNEVQSASPANFSLYPNPASSNFTIETNATGERQELQIFDLTGQLLLTQPIQNSKTSIDAAGLSAGVYLLCLKNKEGTSTQKLVISN